jgi:hypothetical protein
VGRKKPDGLASAFAVLRVAPELPGVRATHCRRKESLVMQQRKMFKVMTFVQRKDGTKYSVRCGSAYENRDNSLNVYLDTFPKTFELNIRELDEADLRKRDDRERDRDANLFNATANTNSTSAAAESAPF